jgi:hypothetical protein
LGCFISGEAEMQGFILYYHSSPSPKCTTTSIGIHTVYLGNEGTMSPGSTTIEDRITLIPQKRDHQNEQSY